MYLFFCCFAVLDLLKGRQFDTDVYDRGFTMRTVIVAAPAHRSLSEPPVIPALMPVLKYWRLKCTCDIY
jgi:hypothetical protein